MGTVQVGGRCETALLAVPVDEERLLDLVKHLELEEARHFGLEKIQAEGVNRADIEFGEPRLVAILLVTPCHDSFLQFSGRLFREGKRDDVRWYDLRLGPRIEEIGHEAGHHLGLARASAGDELQVGLRVRDGLFLGVREVHGFGAPAGLRVGRSPAREKLYQSSPATMMWSLTTMPIAPNAPTSVWVTR